MNLHHFAASAAGIALVILILQDAFETLVLPQTVNRRWRPARLYYRSAWAAWTRVAALVVRGRRHQSALGVFGPLSLLGLFTLWALCLIFAFALLQWSFGSHLDLVRGVAGFGADLYMSGTTFFTLGLGDVTPNDAIARVLTVLEAGIGFGFLALVIGYLPVLYQAFSRRELNISLLDARAGSPPTAEELLRRHSADPAAFERLLADWERWAAELMESHLSYPALAYYRSQHQNQSWLAALTTILDSSAFSIASFEGGVTRQARLTFAIARHAVVDLSQIFHASPLASTDERLSSEGLARIRARLVRANVPIRVDAEADRKLGELRKLYEPYVHALGHRFLFAVPNWSPDSARVDNWRTSAWERIAGAPARARAELELHEDEGG
ncbi:MAG: potassium channel family protein [Candidatus Eisenbacteria bacterium]